MLNILQKISNKKTDEKKLDFSVKKNSLELIEEAITPQQTSLKATLNTSSAINDTCDLICTTMINVSKKLDLDCNFSIENKYTYNECIGVVRISLLKQLSNFTFKKYSDFMKDKVQGLVNEDKLLYEFLFDDNKNEICISIVQI